MGNAAQGFLVRRTFRYAAAGNPRRTKSIGKKTIYGWTLKRDKNADYKKHPRFYVEIDVRQQL